MSQRWSSQGVLWTLAALCLGAGPASLALAADGPAGQPKATPKAPAKIVDPFDAGKPKPVLHAKGDKPRAPHARATGEEAIEKALAQPAEVDFVDTPLSDAVTYLKEYHDIQIVLDRKGLEELGVAADTQITMKVQGVSLRSVLGLILRPLGLTCTIHNEVLLITSPETAQDPDSLSTRIYEVGDLVVCREENDRLWDDYETLEKLVMNHVATDAWVDVGGPGAVTGISVGGAKLLVVTQSYPVHVEVREFLQMLREHAAKTPGDKKPPLRNRPPQGSKMPGMSGMGGMMGGMGGVKGVLGGKMGGSSGPQGPQPKGSAPGAGKSSSNPAPKGDPFD